MIHGIIKYGWALQSQRMGLKWVLVTLSLNTLGAAAYAIKVWSFKLQSQLVCYRVANSVSSFPKGGLKRRLIFLVRAINGFILWSYSPV
jgi:hypothetical protein